MSEPLSAGEIEDVLSSIRRLVSEDLRPVSRAASPPKPALILTPALRVVTDAASPIDILPETIPEPALEALPIEKVVAQVAAAVPEQDWEPEIGDAVVADQPGWVASSWDASATSDDGLPDAEIDPVAVVVDAVATDAPGWAQRGVEGDEVVAAALHDQMVIADEPQQADAEWLAQAEAEVIAGLEGRVEDDEYDAFAARAEMSFEEEVLRDLVRDLIREELQGHLGERITRNIRKLVRAEIARALAAAELD